MSFSQILFWVILEKSISLSLLPFRNLSRSSLNIFLFLFSFLSSNLLLFISSMIFISILVQRFTVLKIYVYLNEIQVFKYIKCKCFHQNKMIPHICISESYFFLLNYAKLFTKKAKYKV